jgi:hypothetical protein
MNLSGLTAIEINVWSFWNIVFCFYSKSILSTRIAQSLKWQAGWPGLDSRQRHGFIFTPPRITQYPVEWHQKKIERVMKLITHLPQYRPREHGVLFCMVWSFVSHVKGRTQIEGVWQQDAQENIWTWEGWSDKRVEKVRNVKLNYLYNSPNNIILWWSNQGGRDGRGM